jgi:hypothetical protein
VRGNADIANTFQRNFTSHGYTSCVHGYCLD